MSEQTIKTYRGNCHCGTHIYEATMPEITKPSACNCSLCFKKGTIWTIVPKPSNDLVWVKGGPSDAPTSQMTAYTFGTGKWKHHFCSNCGDPLSFAGQMSADADPTVGINIRTLQHGSVPDVWDMDIGVFDGASFGSPYEPPVFEGPEPSAAGDHLYTGSCHCGAVRVALRSESLIDENYSAHPIYECNCSGCVRAAGTVLYPDGKALSVSDPGNKIKAYSYGPLQFWEKYFCGDCGVFLGRRTRPVADEVLANLPDMAKKWTVDIKHLTPVNLRLMNTVDGKTERVDLKKPKVEHIPGYGFIQPPYVNP